MNQISLFEDYKMPPHNWTRTSYEAAKTMMPVVESMEERVFRFIEGCAERGATCDEVERRLKLKHQTVSARINGLKKNGRIIRCGKFRKTSSGHDAEVLVVVRG